MAGITNFRGDTTQSSAENAMEAEVRDLMQRVGERVRKARDLRGIPRRLLSEKSCVSPRYLAQLEAGEGNISIRLLQRVSVALDLKIEWFVGLEDPWTSDALRIADLYRAATAERRQKAMDALNPLAPEHLRAQRICLIGLRGAGKSTLGAMASQTLHVPFVELNVEIEEHAGMPIGEVVALYGQDGYRHLEAQALSRIIATHDTVILAVAADILAEGIAASAADVDLVTVFGYGFPRWRGGLIHYADTLGPDRVLARHRELAREDPIAWKPSQMIEDTVARGLSFADWRHADP
ncbi:helix-turn-helix domain-containing protein [Rhodobacteraceae bacterium F11138]|nr:helix-turn-helix domain-containing protein [Rhodobacteraceae bacterium F11138]